MFQRLISKDVVSDKLRYVSDILDDQNKTFDFNTKPIELYNANSSSLKIPDFEFVKKYLNMK